MFSVNGLFGWVRANDQRSILLFGGFLVALQAAAAIALYLPLAGLDEGHAPFLNWGGYLVRYVVPVALAGTAVFAVMMLWHVHSVRRVVAFVFVDNTDEPRLCEIVETLAIGMGLPAPYVAVIETTAMNAFACGIRRGDAVVVVTRGLVDGLDDEELAAVIAHELAHIANGDIRLMAAATVCLAMLRRLTVGKLRYSHPVIEAAGTALVVFVVPPVFVAVLILAFLGQCALRAGHLVRSMIGASREFVADAAAVEATQNPAALVSALKRIDGRSRIPGMSPLQESMMIDGAATGAYATHPTISARVKAMIAVTGSMALIAPSRRDTRQARPAAPETFGRRTAIQDTPAPEPVPTGTGDGRNWLGLTPAATLGAALGAALFIGLQGAKTGDVGRVLAEFDPRPATAVFVGVSRNAVCGLSTAVGRPLCEKGEMQRINRRFAGTPGVIGQMFKTMEADGKMRFRSSDGALRDDAEAEAIAAETTARRCFVTNTYSVGGFGLHPVVPGPQPETENYSIDRWLRTGNTSAQAVAAAADRPDAALADYLKTRKERLRMVHAYFGQPGLDYALQHFGSADHATAIAILQQRLADPAYVASLRPQPRAELQLLAKAPDDFIPCRARLASQPEPPPQRTRSSPSRSPTGTP